MVEVSFPGFVVAVLLISVISGCANFRAAKLYQSGTRALDQGEVASAIQDLEAAEQLAPGASEIQNHLGLAYREAGRSGDALKAFERAVELDCENEAAQRNLEQARREPLGAGR